jgi:hypothetical protein
MLSQTLLNKHCRIQNLNQWYLLLVIILISEEALKEDANSGERRIYLYLLRI